jgi:putative hemolysin
MTPRAKIIWINVADAHDSIWHKIVVSGHTTFPVYEGTRDRVVGVVTVKAIYANLAAGIPPRIRDLMTPPLVIPASLTANVMLEKFKQTGKFVALVADEFGGISGLVSLHDIMEAIIGELPSESERLKPKAAGETMAHGGGRNAGRGRIRAVGADSNCIESAADYQTFMDSS